MSSSDHGRRLFEHRGHKGHAGKPRGAQETAANHGPTVTSKSATSDPGPVRGNDPRAVEGRVPSLPAAEAVSAIVPRGESLYGAEHYRERKVPAGETLLSPKHNNRPKQRVEHFQSAENTAPRKALKHHDRNEDGTNPLHGKVRSGKKPAAPLASELRAIEKKRKGSS